MSIASDLVHSIREELQTEARYKRRAKTADSGTRMLYLHIASEEHNHAVEFKRRLDKI
jgi:rubrerythrin